MIKRKKKFFETIVKKEKYPHITDLERYIDFDHIKHNTNAGGGGGDTSTPARRLKLHIRHLDPDIRKYIQIHQKNKVSKEGFIEIEAKKGRSGKENEEKAKARLNEMLQEAKNPPKGREGKVTEPTARSKQKRKNDKMHRGRQKEERRQSKIYF